MCPSFKQSLLFCAALFLLAIPLSCVQGAFLGQRALPPRPRLILTDTRLQEIKNFVANNSDANLFHQNLRAQGEWILSVPPIAVHKENSTNDLGGARQVLQRVYALGLLFRLTANSTYAARCARELSNAVAWYDWALPVNALVTGELQHTVAVGIDWLDAYWKEPGPAAVRASLVEGLVRLGMDAMRVGYTGPPFPPWANNNTFINTTNNYGEVVNGGTVLGVLGLLGEPSSAVPAWVEDFILPNALKYLVGSFNSFAPTGDGSWYEGPNYQGYVVRYAAPLIFGLRSVLGDDHGLLAYPGVESLAEATVYHLSPQYTLFNWGDSDEAPETTAANLAFAAHFGLKGPAFILRDFIRTIPVPASETGNPSMQASVGLLYFSPLGNEQDREQMARDRFFVGRNLAMFVSSWSAAEATYVGVKAGSNGYNVHLHQDMGSFVFHSHGQRLIADIGRDNYALPCYFCLPQRFRYYRLNALGHNTITFNGHTHDYPAAAKISVFNSTGDGPSIKGVDAWVVMDLTPMYASLKLQRWQRGFFVMENRSVLVVVDEIESGENVDNLTWAAHANATVAVTTSEEARLTVANVTAILRVLPTATSCAGLVLSAVPVVLQPPELSTQGIVRTQLQTADPQRCQRIAVALGVGDQVPKDLNINSIRDWANEGPLH